MIQVAYLIKWAILQSKDDAQFIVLSFSFIQQPSFISSIFTLLSLHLTLFIFIKLYFLYCQAHYLSQLSQVRCYPLILYTNKHTLKIDSSSKKSKANSVHLKHNSVNKQTKVLYLDQHLKNGKVMVVPGLPETVKILTDLKIEVDSQKIEDFDFPNQFIRSYKVKQGDSKNFDLCMLFSHIQFNFENMGLFFQNEDAKYQQRGSSFWPISPTSNHLTSIQGTFNEISPNGTITTINISANDEQLFYERDHQVYFLSYYLTVLQQHFCFYRHQKIYQIKLKRKSTLTILSTTDIETFIQFYLFLAKHCILTTFEKHYKICKPAHQLPRNTDPLRLGRGAYSIVYNGENILSKEEVALKIFQKSSLSSLPFLNKIIENEICILEKLKKYHLSPLINAYETQDCVVFVLLKAQAGNMLDYLCEHQSDYNAEFIKKIMVKILDNLKELHTAGFIHRDIKPQNILFKNSTLNSSLFLGDFGLTVPINPIQDYENKVSRICSGTLGFIAPQIIHSNTYNEKCDIFSMGCLFYFLHKGKSLFANKTADQISRMTQDNRIIHEQITKLDNLTTESYQLMESLLKVDPDERPSADMLLNFEYFKNSEHQQPETGEDDHTLRQYLLQRISRFYSK